MKLDLEKVQKSNELFLDSLLRNVPRVADGKLSIDLTKASWLSDFQLTCSSIRVS